MSAQEFCPTHKVRMLPTGCPLCRRAIERERQAEVEKIKKQGFKALLGLAAVAVVWLFLTREKGPVDSRLDPEAFRAPMESMEKALYTTARLGVEARSELKTAAADLEAALRQAGRFNPKATEDVVFFVFRLGTSAEIDGERFDWSAHRQEWETLRAARFRSAAWFAKSSPALEEAQGTAEARGVVTDVAAYENTILEIERLIQRVDSDFAALPEYYGEVLDPAVSERWSTAERSARQDAERIRAGMPPPPRGAATAWIKTWNELDNTLRYLPGQLFRTVGGDFGLPGRSSAQSRIQTAQARLAKAKRAFADAPR